MKLRAAGAAIALALLCGTLQTLPAAGETAGAGGSAETTAVSTTLEKLYATAYDEAINRHASVKGDGTTYVSSGDINAEWLRDAAATMQPYIALSSTDEHIHSVLRGVIARMARCILIDPYANAFWSDYRVAERKFEIDSLLYPIWFADEYWRQTGDASIFTGQVNRAFERALAVLRTEQHHDPHNGFRHPEMFKGVGRPVKFTGMVWTAFRPSDDAAYYGFNIPENMFAVKVLQRLATIERRVYRNERDAQNAWGLSVEIQRGVEQHGTVNLAGFGKIYAYEVDGRGHANLMDDANVPSLLSIPYFGYLSNDDRAYQATRQFVLSKRNPYYYTGKYASGVGSPHTPRGNVWPLALVVQALTSSDPKEYDRVMGYIANSDVGDHRLHESFNANWPESYTRDDFAWPNALYAELMRRGRP
ncbi:MAG: glycoside hydrolase family 125 protein [Candidatus Eremiobacteraeota bacterium]|nr:glycoside hydrolase family 125 protein [Candidatus Eremiobacteraeota bacterium]